MNEDLVIATRIATKICNILNKQRNEVMKECELTDEFDFAVGRTYIKVGFKHKNADKIYCANAFIDIHNKKCYPSASWSAPNKNYPMEITPTNIEMVAKRIYPYVFEPFVKVS